jgi:hypothetical protein
VQDFLVSGLRVVVEKTAADFDPALLSGVLATRAVEEWAAIEKVACAQKLRSAARAEEAGLDAEAVVANSSGVSTGAARRQTKTAAKVRKHKKTAEAFDKGKLSPTQADAIADAAEANPGAEERLLELAARGSTTDLLNECERVKREAGDDATLAGRQRAARGFRSWTDALGMLRFSGGLEPLIGAKLIAELSRRADRLFREQSRAKVPIDSTEQRMADALAELLETSGGAKRGPRTVVRLIVSKEAAERGWVEPGEKCETAEGNPIPMPAVDDAFLRPDTFVQEVEVDAVDVRSIKTMKKYIPKRRRLGSPRGVLRRACLWVHEEPRDRPHGRAKRPRSHLAREPRMGLPPSPPAENAAPIRLVARRGRSVALGTREGAGTRVK